MNVLLNTPILTTSTLKRDFDNKIIVLLVIFVSVVALITIFFFDIINNSNNLETDFENTITPASGSSGKLITT